MCVHVHEVITRNNKIRDYEDNTSPIEREIDMGMLERGAMGEKREENRRLLGTM